MSEGKDSVPRQGAGEAPKEFAALLKRVVYCAKMDAMDQWHGGRDPGSSLIEAVAAVFNAVAKLQTKEEKAYRGGFLAGCDFGMDQSYRDQNTGAPDENQAWAEYQAAEAGRDGK